MIGGVYFGQVAPGQTPVLSPPNATLISESRVKISRVSGYDSSLVTWQSDSDFSSYQFRVVASSSDPVDVGVLVEQDQSPASGGMANTNYSSTLTDAEVEAVSSGDGTKLVKLFIQNSYGWSS